MMPEDFLRALKELIGLAHDYEPVELHETRLLLYRAGYANGYQDALGEVWQMAEECDE